MDKRFRKFDHIWCNCGGFALKINDWYISQDNNEYGYDIFDYINFELKP